MAEKFNLGEALKKQQEFEGLGLEEKERVKDGEQREAELINDELKKGGDFSEDKIENVSVKYREKKNEVQIIIDKIFSRGLNFELLKDIDVSLHKKIALGLIEAGCAGVVANGLENFHRLDKEVALRLIEAREIFRVMKYSKKFHGLMLSNEIALKLIEIDGRFLLDNLEKFQGLDKSIAMRLIGEGEGRSVMKYPEKFQGLILDKEFVLELFNITNGARLVACYLEKFHGIDREVALKLIEAGEGDPVIEHPEKFQGLILDKETTLKLIKNRNNVFGIRLTNLEKFQGLDKEVALRLIEAGRAREIVENTEKFQDLVLNNDIALKMIKTWQSDVLINSLSKFKELDAVVALKLIENGKADAVIYSGKFKNLVLNKDLALNIIENGQGDSVIHNLDKFQGLDKAVVLKLIEAGFSKIMVGHIEKIRGLAVADNEIVQSIIEFDSKFVADNLYKFQGLDKSFALKLIEDGGASYVLSHSKNFHDLVFDNSIALKMIETKQGRDIASNLEKFQGLDKSFALKLIEDGRASNVLLHSKNFYDLVLNKDIAFKIIETKQGNDIINNLEKFQGLDAEKESAKKFSVQIDEAIIIEKYRDEIEDVTVDQFEKNYYLFKRYHYVWKDEQNISGPFQTGAEYFGYQKMFEYLGREGLSRHDGLHNFRKIFEVAKESGLNPQEFYNNILAQAQKDDSAYEQGTAHHKLNNLVDNINLDFTETITEARKYPDIVKLQTLLDDLDEPQKIFRSWKSLKKYEEICSLLGKREILDQLQTLKKEGKEKMYSYVETLAFHPNISMGKVMEFWKNPAAFLDVGDEHTPEEIQNRKKPSNYFEFPNLDLTPEELRDALVEGAYDRLQVFRPLEIEYAIGKDGAKIEPEEEKSLKDLIFQAVGKRSEGKKGEAQDASALFTELSRFFKSKLQKVALMDYLKTEGAEEKFPQVAGFANEIRQILFDEKTGLKKKMETEEYRAKINLKSDPDGVVAGNDTACCMPFGSGKNNVYTFNPVCSLFTIQKKNSEGRWRTIAQSVLTKDKDIGQNIAELRKKLEEEKTKMHEVVDESALLDKPRLIACDNIEVAQNFQGQSQGREIIKTIYTDFFREYLKRFAKEDNLDEERVPIGLGYIDSLTTLPKENNTFIPEAPVGYSDKLHEQVFMLNVKKELIANVIAKRAVNIGEIKKPAGEETGAMLPKGISYLTFEDSLPVAYIEGKAYRDNESLMEYLHNMENALIAKDVNNTAKNRPNMSFKYTDSRGNIHGYILAYEGVAHREKNQYDDEDDYQSKKKSDEKIIYVSDLASDGSKKAGGALIIGFTEAYKRNYVDKKNPLPILAQFREKTSYQIILKQLEKLSKDVGMKFEMEELGTEEKEGEVMHEVMIRPKI